VLEPFANLVVEPDLFWRAGVEGCSPDRCAFDLANDALVCRACDARVPVTDHVVEFVDVAELDDHKSNELHGNEIGSDADVVEHFLAKEDWSSFSRHFVSLKIASLYRYIRDGGRGQAAFLGSGTGFEIGPLWREGYRPARLFVSDLNRSTLEVAKFNLASQNIDESTQVCLFTSDLDAVPLKDRALPLVVYECLHHTPDMHATIERMLRYGYESICFVEPCSNWLMRIFARVGLAQREEYSGLEPDRLDLKRLRRLCDRYGYRLEVHTMWELPVDYFERVSRNRPWLERVMIGAIDAFSFVLRPFRFGNFAACRLTRRRA